MEVAVLWGLLALLCHRAPVSGHVLGRASSASDLAQLKSLLERFEETLSEAGQDDPDADYEGPNHESARSREWSRDQEGDQEPSLSERAQLPEEAHSRAASQRSRLQELLTATRKRAASSCFGARMDRIGNASGLGCNGGRG